MKECEIATQEKNANARKLYEKCGGILTSRISDFHFWLASKPFNDPVMNNYIPQNKPYLTGEEIINLQDMFAKKQIATH